MKTKISFSRHQLLTALLIRDLTIEEIEKIADYKERSSALATVTRLRSYGYIKKLRNRYRITDEGKTYLDNSVIGYFK